MQRWIFLLIFLIGLPPAVMAQQEPIAIIVNRANETDSVSFLELVNIFKFEKQFWPGGKKIYPLILASEKEKKVMLKTVYKMTPQELKKFWLSALYTGKIGAQPRELHSSSQMKTFISAVPNAVGFILSSEVDDSVKVLKIDGKLPGEPGYKLE